MRLCFRNLWEEEREAMLTVLGAKCEVLLGRLEDYFPY
jgi:hypothetical protein